MQWRRPEEPRPPWYKPVPKHLYVSLGLNLGMLIWNMTFLIIFQNYWMALWATISSGGCLLMLESIANWKKTHDW